MNKKLLLAASSTAVIAAAVGLWVNAATVGTVIKVTTAIDENGTNPAACSLREAVKAINTQEPFGGCPAGVLVGDNVIQLENVPYVLTDPEGALTLDRSMIIAGADTWDSDQENPLTGLRPNRVRPLTQIKAVSNVRLFKTNSRSASLTLRDVIVEGSGSVAGNGGLIYAASTVSIDNVHVKNGHSAGQGGFLYIANSDSSFSASNSTFENNHADGAGGVVAMVCSQDLSALAKHEIAFNQSLLKGNSSTAGAAVVEACGNTKVTLDNTTLSDNASVATSGAIAYDQATGTGVAGYGSVSLDHVTAVNQTSGAVLYLNQIQSSSITSSILAWNTDPACQAPTPPTGRSGHYNAYSETSCNVLTPGATTNQDLSSSSLGSQLAPLGDHKGLTDIYLPLNSSSSLILDKGMALDNCNGIDQRGVARNGGTACDIGAAELMQVAATEVTASNAVKTDRLAIVDVMATARFGENTATIWALQDVILPGVTDITDPDFMYNPVLYGGASPVCKWHDDSETNEKLRRKLVVNNAGVLTGSTPIVCQYKVTDTGGNVSAPSIVTVDIKNVPPIALADTYIRPQGVTSITFDPLENDTDEGDGVYGASPWWITSNPPIYVAEAAQPKLGRIKGTPSAAFPTGQGPCWDSTTSSPKICYATPLIYEANNPDSPFSDSFTYSVYDKDNTASSSTLVTINTDARDPDKGGGSLDMGVVGLLALLGIRQVRRRTR